MPFEFSKIPSLPEVLLVKPKAFDDSRGWMMEAYKRTDFEHEGITQPFVQENHSRSVGRGILRGLHYQKQPAAQAKLVRCLVGEVFDVAVDIRRASPSYGRWAAETLSADNRLMMWIPEGFAHGFCTLTDVAEVVYKVTQEFSPGNDRAIRWNDPEIGIRWPVTRPVLSPKDSAAPSLSDADNNFTYAG